MKLNISNLSKSTKADSKDITQDKNLAEDVKINKGQKILPGGVAYATGKRKASVARVFVKKGSGKININSKIFDKYFTRDVYITDIQNIFSLTKLEGVYDVNITVKGGGAT